MEDTSSISGISEYSFGENSCGNSNGNDIAIDGITSQIRRVSVREFTSFVDAIRRTPKRKRILHDIIPYETIENRDRYIQEIKERGNKYPGGIIILSDHPKGERSHLHIIHDCQYYSFFCRCALLFGLPVKRRSKRHGIWVSDATRDYWRNQSNYCASEERNNIFNKIGGKTWGPLNPAQSNTIEIDTWETEEPVLAVCDDQGGDNNGNSGCSSQSSCGRVSKTYKKKHRGEPRYDTRPTIQQIYQWIFERPVCPISDSCKTIQWLSDPILRWTNKTSNEYKNAIIQYEAYISLLSLEEIYAYLTTQKPLYGCYRGNFEQMYYTVEESVQLLNDLIIFQFYYNQSAAFEFVNTVYKVLNWDNGKKNCIYIVGEANSVKTGFVNLIGDALIVGGTIRNANRYSSFPFDNCQTKRVLHWDEPNCEPGQRANFLTLLSGDKTPANVKYGNETIRATPVFITGNHYIFPDAKIYEDRIAKYEWQSYDTFKTLTKRLHPLSIYQLFINYNIFGINFVNTNK